MYFPRVDCFREDAKSINGFGVFGLDERVEFDFLRFRYVDSDAEGTDADLGDGGLWHGESYVD